ncbi:hypothetical protein [Entomospira culicis]|uniref:Uncharacterized protein n=1 Tax=Entomospira culicis TaxID=2719989 RepID=A0A968GIK1_9SPIO|nr:hypothetical protein [Entomospira culicis]NIZ19101.1 hypothetical protein [Entomospira culicis]NIZ69315.1 hypothetical protein [Entomospira culicis]WDI37901.1 hypothetical protein PVA46_03690 [Entomospira culicis]WDI39528.1 hypothetical protein PVA47_03690 [Entomospira culicis]
MSDAEFKKHFPAKEVGIFNPKPLYNQDVDELVQVTTGQKIRFTANKQKSSYYGNHNEADSLASVWEGTPLAEYFERWTKEFPQLVYEKPATTLQDAYLDVAKAVGRSGNNRYRHNLYAVGTGQTLSAITDRSV